VGLGQRQPFRRRLLPYLGGSSHRNAWGGSTGHAYGGSTYGAYGAGVGHTYPSAASIYGGYPADHQPVAVPYDASSGCYGCAALVVGGNDAMLPSGAIEVSRFGVQYVLSGNTWYEAVSGVNGIFYRVVPAP
jgi:hypothetical protein